MKALLIICPDDGTFEAHEGRCPICGGTSWIPAGAPTLSHFRNLGEDTLNEIRAILNRDSADAESSGKEGGE